MKEKSMIAKKVIKIAMVVFQIVGTAVYVYITVVLIASFIFGFQNLAQKGMVVLGGVLAFLSSMFISIGYIIPVVLGGIGVFISSKMNCKKSKIYFKFMIFIPVATVIVVSFIYLILLS